MLCRDAEACYWIGRYVERAEATARMVDVHYHTSLESLETLGSIGWQPILAISGNSFDYNARYGKETDRDVLHFFAFDEKNPDSILSTWTAARENARSIRELIASEMWEAINVSYLELREWNVDRILRTSPYEFFTKVKNASHLFQGIFNRTMIMSEPREWIDTGRFLERSCQTARILDVKYHNLLPASLIGENGDSAGDNAYAPDLFGVGGPLDTHGWTAVLKSVSAFEMFCKTYHEGIHPIDIVEFLVLNPHLPASVRHGVDRVEKCLKRIEGSNSLSPASEPDRLIGRLRADLTYTSSKEIIAQGLHSFLAGTLSQFDAIGLAIWRTYLD